MDNSADKQVSRFISGGREIKKAASADAKEMKKAHGFALSATVLVTLILSVSAKIASHIMLDAAKAAFVPGPVSLASAALVFDFLVTLIISAGLGTAVFICAKGTVSISDVPKAALAMLPLTAITAFAVGACVFTLACFGGSVRFVIAGVIIAVSLGEMKRYLFFPAVIALSSCDIRSARAVSAKMAHADSDTVSADMRRLAFASLFSLATLLVGAVFVIPGLVARITADAKAILPDYDHLLSYTKTKEGEKKWQKKRSSI